MKKLKDGLIIILFAIAFFIVSCLLDERGMVNSAESLGSFSIAIGFLGLCVGVVDLVKGS